MQDAQSFAHTYIYIYLMIHKHYDSSTRSYFYCILDWIPRGNHGMEHAFFTSPSVTLTKPLLNHLKNNKTRDKHKAQHYRMTPINPDYVSLTRCRLETDGPY